MPFSPLPKMIMIVFWFSMSSVVPISKNPMNDSSNKKLLKFFRTYRLIDSIQHFIMQKSQKKYGKLFYCSIPNGQSMPISKIWLHKVIEHVCKFDLRHLVHIGKSQAQNESCFAICKFNFLSSWKLFIYWFNLQMDFSNSILVCQVLRNFVVSKMKTLTKMPSIKFASKLLNFP